jgi:hypothetical protein
MAKSWVTRTVTRGEEFGLKQAVNAEKAVALFLALFAIFHLQQLANFTLSIDDEVAAFRVSADVWLGSGRWTVYLFERFVLPQSVLPFLPLALFGLFSAIGYLFFLRAVGEQHPGPWSFALFPIFASFPTWAFLTAFQSNTPTAGLGVLSSCCTACLFRLDRERLSGTGHRFGSHWRLALAGLIGAAAIGCYQSFTLFIAVALVASIMSLSLASRPMRLVLRDSIAAIALLAISLALYILILGLFLVFSGTRISYISYFVRLDVLRDYPGQVVAGVLSQMKDVYLGESSVYGYASPAITLLIALAAGGTIYHAYRIAGRQAALLAGVGIVALLAAPFGMNLMSGGHMPVRTLVGVPVALTSLGLLGLRYGPRWISRVGVVVLVLVYLFMFKSLGEFNAARELVQLHDRNLALALSERIATVADSTASGAPLKLDVFGFKSFQTPFARAQDSSIGASFFEWDGGNPWRMVIYMRLIGLPAFDVVDPERRAGLLDEFVLMPPWPAKGAVRVAADGTILVKLSDAPNPNYRQLLVDKELSAKADDKSFYRLSTAANGSWSVLNAVTLQTGEQGIVLDTKSDPLLMFETGASRTVNDCSRIELHTRLKIERPTGVQVFYKKPGQTQFGEDTSTYAQILPALDGGFVDVNLQLISREGFSDSFRFDPVDGLQRVTVGDIELFCRHYRHGAG